ncbi:circadian clock protein KaiA [Oscillatoriales cyanobacterium LEGE 11467]|uniref:Circadian clock oscillator protein KaiA n=2 Tax=Zarconia TaxID=2992130 RepID=A0A928Z8P6_9CYAN|nr:circadian clock protein KaiA [Zarconia navalis]MBE9040046.1 circadian clock protein KaiA [Zarconia navalis LEGE 11467]
MVESVDLVFDNDRYTVTHFQASNEFLEFIEKHYLEIDCLILQNEPILSSIAHRLCLEGRFLPAVILQPTDRGANNSNPLLYHKAAIYFSVAQLDRLIPTIDKAIAQFLSLSPTERFIQRTSDFLESTKDPSQSLMDRQRRLSEKLKERLGYLGVYYKRNPQFYLRNQNPSEREQSIAQLKSSYREIILNYFSDTSDLNQKIDEFVNLSFFADISVTYVVEIHMELIDEFSKQLKLEGRNEEILLDYRLTLIDIIAHLCEMYRRSIPREP